MSIPEIQSYLSLIETNPSLYHEKNFIDRIEVIDFIEYEVIRHITSLPLEKQDNLTSRAEKIIASLEQANDHLFEKLRNRIRTEKLTGKQFNDLVNEYVEVYMSPYGEPGYDNLDIFINLLLNFQALPEPTKTLEPEMVFYQKTPANMVFELVEKAHLTKEDIFIDIGSGFGQVAILVNLLTEVTTKGIDFEPAFIDYAEACAGNLALTNITFINSDARTANYSEGNVFFMFTPFQGEMLKEVLALLRKESLHRKIRIITLGPCTAIVALESWLIFEEPRDENIYRVGFFVSA